MAVLVTALLVTRGTLDPSLFPMAVILAATTFAPVIVVADVAGGTQPGDRSGGPDHHNHLRTRPVSDLVSEPPPETSSRVRFQR